MELAYDLHLEVTLALMVIHVQVILSAQPEQTYILCFD